MRGKKGEERRAEEKAEKERKEEKNEKERKRREEEKRTQIRRGLSRRGGIVLSYLFSDDYQ